MAAHEALPSAQWQKYQTYKCTVDNKQNDRATELQWFSVARPHMRAFYVSTFSFFIAFLSWFAFAPLMPEIKKSLHLTKNQVYTANVLAVTSTFLMRMIMGPLCDTFGPRQTFSLILFLGAIPSYCSGLIQNATGLAIIRFFIGILGSTFVCNQAWTSAMFAKEIVGTANATSAGWGNLGGGVTHIFMTGLWSGFKNITDPETAWRVSFVVPATIVMLCAFMTTCLAEDSPKGNLKELIAHGSMVRKSSKKAAGNSYRNFNTWLLAASYACCFGMELVIFNIATSYYHDQYGLTTVKASLVSASFGFLNVISRSMGGWLSDKLFHAYGAGYTGMRGRFLALMLCLSLEAAALITFSRINTLAASIGVLVVFAFGVQMSNGATYSLVPYVEPDYTGAVSGVVGAGGNFGAIVFGLIFRFGPSDPQTNFFICGFVVVASACMVPLMAIRGHDSLLRKAKGEPAAVDVI